MTESEKREAARQFYQKWAGKGREDEDDRSYWLDVLQRIMGADDATDRVEFQKKVVVDGNTKRMRAVCGRLKSDYRYSKDIVYNNFPWPTTTDEQKAAIEKSAQAILDARALYPDCSLADLYDPLTMPPELRKAHQANDRAVMQAYGLDVKTTSEEDCVAFLMKMYQELTKTDK